MVDAADLKSYPPKKYPEKYNKINRLKVLTFLFYTYTCLTHFWCCKAQQIFCLMAKALEAADAKSVCIKKI
tara:strand:+ start:296 stop:508 length:213 start_codon:yes stop_codon:yes gene_type:complete